MRGAANRHPRAPQPISNGWGGAMTSPVLLSYPSPTWLLVLGSQSREVWGRGMGGELVMSPFLCVIGCRVAGLRPINSLEKSGAAPRKALLPPGGGPAVVGWRALQCGQRAWPAAVETSQLPAFWILGQRTFLIVPTARLRLGLKMGKGGSSWGFTLHSVGEHPCGCSHLKGDL